MSHEKDFSLKVGVISMPMTFEIVPEHLKLLSCLHVDRSSNVPVFDYKKPYGNENILSDIADILNAEPSYFDDNYSPPKKIYSRAQNEFFNQLHSDLWIVLQIVLSTKNFSAGKYCRSNQWDWASWEKEQCTV